MRNPTKILILLLMSYFIYKLLIVRVPYTFLDNVNLLFHEAGHILFLPFGQFLHVLGGSLTQCLIPLITLVAFLRNEDYDGALFSTFWFGENLINVSYYMGDAEKQILPLIGGGGHDWNYLLGVMHVLPQAELLGGIVFYVGAMVMICVFGVLLLFSMKPKDQ